MTETRTGIWALVASCSIWGLSPLFYKTLTHVPATEILAHRTVWSLVFFALVLGWQGRLTALPAVLRIPRQFGITMICAVMISVNWALFIWSVQVGRTTEASLGYYIFPLVAVVMGVLVYRERLGTVQWVAVVLAAAGVLVLTIGLGAAPWISLSLAATFGTYSVIKKGLETGPVLSVSAEVTVLTPLAVIWLIWLVISGKNTVLDLETLLLLIVSGVLTGLPLLLFSYGARRVRMATTGLIQYINPTFQFLCAVIVFGEPFGALHGVAFALIWMALALYSGVSYAQDKARRNTAMTSSADAPD